MDLSDHVTPQPACQRILALLTVLATLVALAGGVLAPLGIHAGEHVEDHDDTAVGDRHVSPRDGGAHDACWVAEVAPHERHDDARFEDLLDVHHRRHVPVAEAVASPLPELEPAEHAVRRTVESPAAEIDTSAPSVPLRGPRQSRAPPRA